MFPSTVFPSVAGAIQDGINRQLHTGMQIYASLNGSIMLDSAFGEAAPGRAMTTSTLMPWRSAAKPLTALLVMQQIESHRLELSTRVAKLLCVYKDSDLADITIFDLLTHQSGFPLTETGWPQCDWDESIRRILNAPRQLDNGTAAYHPQSSWFLLGRVLPRLEPGASSSGFS